MLALVLSVVSAGPVSAHHAVNASNGNCTAHTTACWPNCSWEWMGQAGGGLSGQPADSGPCEMPVQAWVAGASGGSVSVSLDDPVAVGNWPATLTDERVPVSAVCEAGVPCVANGNASEVEIVNPPERPVEVGGDTLTGWWGRAEFALGVLLFCAGFALVSRLAGWF